MEDETGGMSKLSKKTAEKVNEELKEREQEVIEQTGGENEANEGNAERHKD
jgi:hypothetical protein